ncbi:MAG TPA: 3-hydroxybutyryl-CoA dehydrogenase [Alphaproteobacteria bacterium]|nr:3-hydroxybutyryl-CoA dehydrogenase [Alphaproteobacteria bacterium]
MEKIGIIGAGQMGNGIAHVAALAGYEVRLCDISKEALDKATQIIERNMNRQVARGTVDEARKRAAFARIKTGTGFDQFSDCDLVIESASENLNVKSEILKSLCPVLRKDALIATNTSSISITRLASLTDRPPKFMGMHFMNPVPVMELVELIRGLATAEETFKTIRELCIKLGKTPANAEDFPAFIVNRILLPMINEAVYALYEGVGSVEAIDVAMRLGAHHPMGPLELADFIGLDTCLAVMHVLYEGLSDSKYRPCPLLVKYVEAGWLGRKTGRGFYDYGGEKPVPTR